VRFYELHRREILLSEALHRPQQQSYLLVQLAFLSQAEQLDVECAQHDI
jgi:predicted transcriptional regulator